MESFDPGPILRALQDHGVAFIVIGGVAAGLHGSPSLTLDLDICYRRTPENLGALARALRVLGARLRGAPPDLPIRLDARWLANGDHFTFSCELGPFDCLGTPAGTSGYDDLIRNVTRFAVSGMELQVAGLDDLMRMKRAAGRPKDRVELEILGALRDELDREGR